MNSRRSSIHMVWASLLLCCCEVPAAEGVVTIRPEVAVTGVQRFGINLGFRTSWGAEQLMSNVLMNPGFEGIVDRSLVAAQPLDAIRFLDQSAWLGRPDGFWDRADFQVRTGKAAGLSGKILRSTMTGTNGLPEYTASVALTGLTAGDRIALTKINDTGLPTQWWIPGGSAGTVGISLEPRPGSAGRRSLRLQPKANGTAEIHSYLDNIGERAGVLLPIEGSWRLAFWARAEEGASHISVTFARSGGRTWVDRNLALTAQWQRLVVDFKGGEDGTHGVLDLRFRSSANVLLDDAELFNLADLPSAFRRQVQDDLEALHPAYLRDWQGQLGETLQNRLAPAEGRRASRYQPGGDAATDFRYSLPEFLDLCRAVHANPWIIGPTTFSDAEWTELGRYLVSRSNADRFSEILVEFGNENWNGIFSAAGITDSAQHAAAASRAFRYLAEGSGPLSIKAVVNAQYANPGGVADIAGRLAFPAMISVAPYFFTELNASQTPTGVLPALFAGDGGTLRQDSTEIQRELGVYEVNLHTTNGDAPGEARTGAVAGAASGTALARHVLNAMALGIRRQCVYVLSGLDNTLPNSLGYTRLWGVARDLATPHRFRPTGLALTLLNQTVGGDLYRFQSPFPDLTVAPFLSNGNWSVALASSAPEPREVTLDFPEMREARLPVRGLMLHAADALDTNETSEMVTIAPAEVSAANRRIKVQIPAYGLAVLLPEESHGR